MIAIVDYEAGNLTSVARAVRHIGFPCVVTGRVEEILGAERIIFPGVGAAGSAMAGLRRHGLDAALKEAFHIGKPILGICLGTQIVMGRSEENDTPCLGLLEGEVKAFTLGMVSDRGERLKVPHMGWNNVTVCGSHPFLRGTASEHQFYFVHGYYPVPRRREDVLGRTAYGIAFASVLGRDNLVATQFHPEKSGKPGLALLRNFCTWRP